MSETPDPPAARRDLDPRDLDPRDWDAFRRDAHRALDAAIDHVAGIRDRPVWQPAPSEVRARYRAPLPRAGRDLADLIDTVAADVAPYTTGNLHPRFMGWVHGAGTPYGLVAEMLAAGFNMNCGGRDHIGLEIERQVTRWMAEAVGLPLDASGIFVTGSSQANFMALLVAKCAAVGAGTRADGLRGLDKPLVAYTSTEAHGCIAQAMELAGIGSAGLRRIAVDAAGRMDVEALEGSIAADRAAGRLPFLVVGTAGTVNTGALDPLDRIADVARRQQIWFHVDGAIGALASLSPKLKPLIAGIERAQSVAFDFHKWGHVPYDAGFLLVRDAGAHKRAFAAPAAYLQRAPRGLAAGETWPNDLGPDLSRGARALKVWMTIAALGADRIGDAILHDCELARYFAAGVERHPDLTLAAPVALNIVCFSAKADSDGTLNRDIVMDLHESGVAAPSWTTIAGRSVIRCALVNHRTTKADIDLVIDAVGSIIERRSAHSRAG